MATHILSPCAAATHPKSLLIPCLHAQQQYADHISASHAKGNENFTSEQYQTEAL